MSELVLQAQTRKVLGKKVHTLRKEGKIPAILYGSKIKTHPLQLDYRTFETVYKQAGESSLVDLATESGKPVKVLIHAVQRNPLTERFEHVDLYQVDLKKKITADIELSFINESPAVKELGGVLVKSLDRIKVECLPEDLVHEIQVDLTPLKTFEDMIYVKDIAIPANITVVEKADETIALVKPPRSEDELKELDQVVEEKVEEVEKVEKKEKEAEEDEAEGETPAKEQKTDSKETSK